MLKSIIDKICTYLKIKFFFKRAHSPNSTSKAKAQQGHAVATSGDHSSVQIGDSYHYYKEPKETTSHTKSWATLLKLFSPESAQNWARKINDPKGKDTEKHNLNGYKRFLSQYFENIGLDHSDPNAAKFNQIQKESISSIEELYNHGDKSQFIKAWDKYLLDLTDIKKKF